jgi:hypothetical protein
MLPRLFKILPVFGLTLALVNSASAISFDFTSGNSGLSSSKTYTVDGMTVVVSAHSWTGSSWDTGAKVGQYNGYGLGVVNGGNDGSHTVDSDGWVDYLKFAFSPVPADVNSISIGYEAFFSDSDFRYWLNNTGVISSTGGTFVNGVGPSTYNIEVGNSTAWNYLIIAADRANTGLEANRFKISGLNISTARVPNADTVIPDTGSTLVLFVLGLMCLVGRRKRIF